MRTNIEVDDQLIAEVMRRGSFESREAAVEQALRTFIDVRRELDIRELRGTGWEGDLEAWRRDAEPGELGPH